MACFVDKVELCGVIDACQDSKILLILFSRKDDDWKLSRGVYIFVTIGLLLLLGAISAVIVVVKPWTVRED